MATAGTDGKLTVNMWRVMSLCMIFMVSVLFLSYTAQLLSGEGRAGMQSTALHDYIESELLTINERLDNLESVIQKRWMNVQVANVLGCGTSVESLRVLYSEFANDVLALKYKVMLWANKTDLHQGIGDVEAEIIYLRLRKLRPHRVAELGFGQGLATRYILQALEDNGRGHLYTFDLKDQWNRGPKMELQHRWTLTLGDGRKTLDLFAPYEYVHSDCEHSTDFARFIGSWLKRHQGAVPILFSFHDVYKWPPHTKEAKCEGAGMHRDAEGISPEGRIMLGTAKEISASPVKGSFTVAMSHARETWQRVQMIRHSIGLDDNWVCDTEKFANPDLFRKGGKKKLLNVSLECKQFMKMNPLQPMIYFEV